MPSKWKKRVCLALALALAWLGAKYLLPVFTPFLLGGLLALTAEPGVRFLSDRLRLPRPAAAGIGDPPYNERQYPPYYHILETAVTFNYPSIYGITGRFPYKDKLSPFCVKQKAQSALVEIVRRAKFKDIFISYSTEGIIDYDALCVELKSFGEVDIFFKKYRRYKSNLGDSEAEKNLKELIIYVHKR